ncbi:peptidylprolyl isomerase [Lutimonas sp.]|uniref:peptidylprolyl isomerase n=1 Tax=Lutimonas sp. TaxID=1872403 RepID=UPI003D9BA8DF
MLKKYVFIIFLWTFFSGMSQDKIVCRISTSMGDIDVALYQKKAPITVANFLRYVDANLYQNSSFFRVCTPENEADREIKIQVIQGGDVPENEQFEAIEIETTEKTGILHKNGTLSMARAEPNSATCSFFICIGDQASLDYGGQRNPDGQGFAAFGQVLKGMELVKKIQDEKDDGQYLVNPIIINSIKRIN